MSDPREAEAEWAYTYDGYKRLAGEPRYLEAVVDVARDEYRRTGRVPPWCGVDLLRGWAFTLHRIGHFSSHDVYDREWDAVLQAVRDHPAANPGDLPPTPSHAAPSAPDARGARRHRFPPLSSADVPEGDDRE
jgi:hypothetical protein